MDMWGPYISSTHAHVPGAEAKIVFDKFHIVAHLKKAVDDVRKAEHRQLRALGDETLKGTKYRGVRSIPELPSSRNGPPARG